MRSRRSSRMKLRRLMLVIKPNTSMELIRFLTTWGVILRTWGATWMTSEFNPFVISGIRVMSSPSSSPKSTRSCLVPSISNITISFDNISNKDYKQPQISCSKNSTRKEPPWRQSKNSTKPNSNPTSVTLDAKPN